MPTVWCGPDGARSFPPTASGSSLFLPCPGECQRWGRGCPPQCTSHRHPAPNLQAAPTSSQKHRGKGAGDFKRDSRYLLKIPKQAEKAPISHRFGLSSFQRTGLGGHKLLTPPYPKGKTASALPAEGPVPRILGGGHTRSHPLPQLLLQQQTDDGVGHAEPHGRSHDENLLEPSREGALRAGGGQIHAAGPSPRSAGEGRTHVPAKGTLRWQHRIRSVPGAQHAYFYAPIGKQIISLELGRQRVWLCRGEVKPGSRDLRGEHTPASIYCNSFFFSQRREEARNASTIKK